MNFSPEAIHVDENQLQITWNDKHVSSFSAFILRNLCPCANCVHEITGEKILDSTKISSDIKIVSAEPTGHYAISLGFTDAHSTGIYSYEMLRKKCPCCSA